MNLTGPDVEINFIVGMEPGKLFSDIFHLYEATVLLKGHLYAPG
jgi:hypothetical protein